MRLDRTSVPPLYALTSPNVDVPVVEAVQQLIAAGVHWIQVREKGHPDAEVFARLNDITETLPAKVMLFVNDRVDLALAVHADGVHLGDEDLSPAAAREVSGDRPLIIGYSTHSADDAIRAAEDPAIDYVAIGPVFQSKTKDVRAALGVGVIEEIAQSISKPLIAIGGIDATNIADVLKAGATSCAVIAALYGGGSIYDNVLRLLEAAEAAR